MARIVKTVKMCDRCAFGTEKPAVRTRAFAIDEDPYEIDVCEDHDRQLDRDLGIWSRLARPREFMPRFKVPSAQTSAVFTPEDNEAARKAATLRNQQQPERVLRQVHPEPANKTIPPVQAAPRGGFDEWVVTPHARERAEQRGFDLLEVLMTATEPEQSYRGELRYGDRSRIHQRGECAVVVDPATKVVITVLHRTGEQYNPTAHRSEIARTAR